MKKILSLFIIILVVFSGCTQISDIELPEPTPTPTAQPTPEPTEPPQPTVAPDSVPTSFEELGDKIGMKIFLPQTLPEGYNVTQLGLNAENIAAVRLVSEVGELLYTYQVGVNAPPEASEEKDVKGFTVYYSQNEISSQAEWSRGGNTFCIISEPQLSFEDMSHLIEEMLKGPVLNEDEKDIDISSLVELSNELGFRVTEPKHLPDTARLIKMSCYMQYTASMQFLSEADIITFRVCEGGIYPPHDYTLYPNPPAAESIEGMEVTLYHSSTGNIALAEWQSNGYSHQIFCEHGVTLQLMQEMIAGFTY